eukprot:2283453-Prymnesium_polylepis.3
MEGAYGAEHDRPDFAEPAPALLGFDSTIWEFCLSQIDAPDVHFSQQAIAERCVQSSNNILRVVSGNWDWNMYASLVAFESESLSRERARPGNRPSVCAHW